MTINKFKKIFVPRRPLVKSDLSPAEKAMLYQIMIDKGATAGFAYDRFFKEGFFLWEIVGIWKIKTDYIEYLHCHEKIEMEVRCVETIHTDDGDVCKYRHFYHNLNGEEKSFDITEKGDFWRMLGDIRHRLDFGRYMAERGMKSHNTVAKRFNADDWKEYEADGIQSTVTSFVENINRNND